MRVTQCDCRPSELAITVAALPTHNFADGWLSADEVSNRLRLLGFDCSTQRVAACLKRMAATEAPWVETRRNDTFYRSYNEYRVTRFGRTDIDNRLPAITVTLAWLEAGLS